MLQPFCAGTGRPESHQRGKGLVPKVPSAGCTGEDWIKEALSIRPSEHLLADTPNKNCFFVKLFDSLELRHFDLDITP